MIAKTYIYKVVHERCQQEVVSVYFAETLTLTYMDDPTI